MSSTKSEQQLKHELNQKWTAIETWFNPKVNSNWYNIQWVQPRVNSNWRMSSTRREFDSTSAKHCLVFQHNLRKICSILQLPGDAFLWRPSGWQVTYPQQQQFEASGFSNCWRIHTSLPAENGVPFGYITWTNWRMQVWNYEFLYLVTCDRLHADFGRILVGLRGIIPSKHLSFEPWIWKERLRCIRNNALGGCIHLKLNILHWIVTNNS